MVMPERAKDLHFTCSKNCRFFAPKQALGMTIPLLPGAPSHIVVIMRICQLRQLLPGKRNRVGSGRVVGSRGRGLAQLSQLRTFVGFFALIFVVKPCVFIVAL
jgi:hypothetical protein